MGCCSTLTLRRTGQDYPDAVADSPQRDESSISAQPEATGADCSCLWEGSFSEVAPETDLVILGEVQTTKGNAVDVVPERILKGAFMADSCAYGCKQETTAVPQRRTSPPAVAGSWRCRRSVRYPRTALTPLLPMRVLGARRTILSSCGGYWLRVNGNTATGNLVPGTPRFSHQPDMSPVLIDLIAGFMSGTVTQEALMQASRERPEEVDTLILDTRSFLRGQEGWIPDDDAEEKTPAPDSP